MFSYANVGFSLCEFFDNVVDALAMHQLRSSYNLDRHFESVSTDNPLLCHLFNLWVGNPVMLIAFLLSC